MRRPLREGVRGRSDGVTAARSCVAAMHGCRSLLGNAAEPKRCGQVHGTAALRRPGAIQARAAGRKGCSKDLTAGTLIPCALLSCPCFSVLAVRPHRHRPPSLLGIPRRTTRPSRTGTFPAPAMTTATERSVASRRSPGAKMRCRPALHSVPSAPWPTTACIACRNAAVRRGLASRATPATADSACRPYAVPFDGPTLGRNRLRFPLISQRALVS